MIWVMVLLLAAVAAAAGGGEWHGRRVAYGRRAAALQGLVAQMEVLAGRWSARRVAAKVIEQAGMPASRGVLGPDVALAEIEETDADRAFDPAACPDGCADCAAVVGELLAEQAAEDAAEARRLRQPGAAPKVDRPPGPEFPPAPPPSSGVHPRPCPDRGTFPVVSTVHAELEEEAPDDAEPALRAVEAVVDEQLLAMVLAELPGDSGEACSARQVWDRLAGAVALLVVQDALEVLWQRGLAASPGLRRGAGRLWYRARYAAGGERL